MRFQGKKSIPLRLVTRYLLLPRVYCLFEGKYPEDEQCTNHINSRVVFCQSVQAGLTNARSHSVSGAHRSPYQQITHERWISNIMINPLLEVYFCPLIFSGSRSLSPFAISASARVHFPTSANPKPRYKPTVA